MNPINELRFAVSDLINNVEVGPKHVPLALLGEFQKDVSEFLKGSGRDVDPMQVQVAVEEGSLALRVFGGLIAATTLWTDLEHLKSPDSLNLIDAKRASVVERWQAAARLHPQRSYAVQEQGKKMVFAVNNSTNYHRVEDVWVSVEKYLHGTIMDWGGVTKANVHLKLENGKTLTVESSQKLIAQEEHNLVYRPAFLHVTAEENLVTGDLRNLRLLAFEAHQPSYDDEEFKRMVERGTQAWADVPDSRAWVETLRGGKG
jgi:predicted Zn-dependent protease with MMP-like domain